VFIGKINDVSGMMHVHDYHERNHVRHDRHVNQYVHHEQMMHVLKLHETQHDSVNLLFFYKIQRGKDYTRQTVQQLGPNLIKGAYRASGELLRG
jgi:hypothetical protein